MNKQNGFTLVEISIVLVIIGLILGAVMLSGTVVIGNTKTTGTISLIKDLSGAVADFKNRYHYLPGDLPKAGDDIPGITGQTFAGHSCNIAAGNGTIGDGQIDTTDERDCVAVELVQAGFIKGSTTGILSPFNGSTTPDVFVLANSLCATFVTAYKFGTPTLTPFSVQNVIEIQNIPCDAAIAIDSKIDDGDTTKGNARSNPACINGASGIPATTTLDVAL